MLMPSAQPPHKQGQSDMVDATDRLAMCRIAVASDSLFEVSDLELNRSGPSYTYDTVRQLKARHFEKVSWLIGADMLLLLPKWHRAAELVDEADMLVMRRPGFEIDWSRLPERFRELVRNVVDAPLIDISATDIRRRVRAGEPITGLVPSGVERYIKEHGLYRE